MRLILLLALSATFFAANAQQALIVDTILTFDSYNQVTGENGMTRDHAFKYPGLPRVWNGEQNNFAEGTIYTVVNVLEKPDEAVKASIRLAIFSYPRALEELDYPSASAEKHGIFGGACKDGCKENTVFVLDRHKKATRHAIYTPPVVFDSLCTYELFSPVKDMQGIQEFVDAGIFNNQNGSIMILPASESGEFYNTTLGVSPAGVPPANVATNLFPLKVQIISYLVAKGKKFTPPPKWPNIPCREQDDPCKS